MSTNTKRQKEQSAAVGSACGRFLRARSKMDYLFWGHGRRWTTFFGLGSAFSDLFLHYGPQKKKIRDGSALRSA